MSSMFRASIRILALSLSLINPTLAQSQSAPNPPNLTEVNDLAVALVAAAEDEQERLLARNNSLANNSLLAALKALANPFVQKGDYAQAIRISQLVVRIAERIGDRVGLGNALCDLGQIYERQYRAAQALDYLQKSLAVFEEVGDKKGKTRALLNIGGAYASQRRFDQALKYYEKGLSESEGAGDRSFIGVILNNMGNAHTALGRPELGLELFQKSRAISEELNDKRTLDLALNNMATIYSDQGRYAEALEYYQKCVKIIEEMGSAVDKLNLAIRLQNIGVVYRRQGHPDQALAYARRSLKILEELGDKFGVANLQNNIGVVYKSQGLYDQALEVFQKSLQRYEELQHKGGIARSLNNIGDAYRLQGRYDQALEHLNQSLRLREENDRPAISLTLNNLSRLYENQGRYAEMLEVSRRAVRLAEELNGSEELWTAQDGIGRALRALGQPVEARRHFLAAISTINSMRRQVAGGGQQRQSFLENRLSPWLGMIDLLVSQKEYAEALTFAEQSKARVLLDVLQSGRASLRESLAPQERQTEEEQRLRLVALNSQLTSELRRNQPDQARVAELKAGVEKARLEYEALETSLYAEHRELKVHRGEASIIKAEDLNALLPDTTSALLEYVVAEDRTYLFVITKAAGKAESEVQVYTIPIKRGELAKQTESFRAQLAGRDLGFRAPAHKLYDLLLKPAQALLRGKTNLVIVPDDKLWELPFQALLNQDSSYLIERSAVSYTPSLTVLREMKAKRNRRAAEPAGPALLALGNPALYKETAERAALTHRNEKFDPLPEAELEVKALRRLYGVSRSKVYIGAEAREDVVKTEGGQAGVLHFATHAMMNDASPMYSHLVLAKGDTNEDGLLEAWELMRMDLKADLAVLSACETARGRFGAGEGMIGLSWALFVAGVPSTVVSQWKVESAGARDLMLSFHRQLRALPTATKPKATKAEALRQAALTLMKNPETSHPFYWAGFVLVGEGR
ncbi:MAG TPA: CHAT domain-containing tetratricopeptide repeat protein [Blastocatellia bacterium]|nr:CHAT domain-containing tetratricopeptide repeat protein [Blastocatellia bacterium]